MGRQHFCFMLFKRMLHLHRQSFHCFTKFIHFHIPCGLRSYDSTDQPISRNTMSFMKWGGLSGKVLDLCSQGFHHVHGPGGSQGYTEVKAPKKSFPPILGFTKRGCWVCPGVHFATKLLPILCVKGIWYRNSTKKVLRLQCEASWGVFLSFHLHDWSCRGAGLREGWVSDTNKQIRRNIKFAKLLNHQNGQCTVEQLSITGNVQPFCCISAKCVAQIALEFGRTPCSQEYLDSSSAAQMGCFKIQSNRHIVLFK